MFCLLSSSHDKGQSIDIYHSCMKHALSVVIISWQRTEHGNISSMYLTCSVSCLRLMTTDRAWSYIPEVWIMIRQLSSSITTDRAWLDIPKVWIMLHQLSSSHANGQRMVIHQKCMKHAPSVVIAAWQRTEHGYTSLKYKPCLFSGHRLLTTVRAW